MTRENYQWEEGLDLHTGYSCDHILSLLYSDSSSSDYDDILLYNEDYDLVILYFSLP